MLNQQTSYPQEKYYRKKPVREFDLNQTLYNTIFVQNKDKMDVDTIEVPIINGYGNNELTGGAIMSPVYANKPDSVGIPMKGISVVVLKEDVQKESKGIINSLETYCSKYTEQASVPTEYIILDKFPVKASGKRDMEKLRELIEE